MPKPKDTSELCDRLRPYLRDLTAWLQRRADEIDELQKGKGHEGDDPPPVPPDLGP